MREIQTRIKKKTSNAAHPGSVEKKNNIKNNNKLRQNSGFSVDINRSKVQYKKIYCVSGIYPNDIIAELVSENNNDSPETDMQINKSQLVIRAQINNVGNCVNW